MTHSHFFRSISTFVIVAVASVGLMACGATTDTTSTPSSDNTQLQEKQGTTTLNGTVAGSEGSYVLESPTSPPTQLESYDVDFSQYVGDRVTVKGQYSGNTLFVSEIE